jgi:hypothetical protein
MMLKMKKWEFWTSLFILWFIYYGIADGIMWRELAAGIFAYLIGVFVSKIKLI